MAGGLASGANPKHPHSCCLPEHEVGDLIRPIAQAHDQLAALSGPAPLGLPDVDVELGGRVIGEAAGAGRDGLLDIVGRGAAKLVGMPVVISFTVETDGKLPTGQTLKEAIERVDEATQSTPAYYMINCAHPSHFADILVAGESWAERIRGIRANASTKSHAELNESVKLDQGDPVEFGRQHRALIGKLKHLSVLGGCCGTDYRHIEEICKACIVPA